MSDTPCGALVPRGDRRYFQRRISRPVRHYATNNHQRAVVTAIESFNKVVDLARDLGDPGLKKALMDFRDELKALIVENQRLRDQYDGLLAQLQKKGMGPPATRSVKFERGAYWLVDDDGILRGPMCRKCWESKQELHRCNQQMQYFFMCSQCGTVARLPGVKPA
jgi:hypothetical protein